MDREYKITKWKVFWLNKQPMEREIKVAECYMLPGPVAGSIKSIAAALVHSLQKTLLLNQI